MKKSLLHILISISSVILVLVIARQFININKTEKINNDISHQEPENQAENFSSAEKSEAGIDYELRYFKFWHYPYSNVIPPQVLKDMRANINKLPDEKDLSFNPVNSWVPYGPFGMSIPDIPNIRYTGRILDIELTPNASTRIAAASGGLWGYSSVFPLPLSDKLDNSIAIGSFASKPGNPNIIIAGTGEPFVRGGQGIFLTTNSGNSWTASSFDIGNPDGIFKIRYSPQNSDTIFAATTTGFYRSDNGGLNFNRKISGICSDLMINPAFPNHIWVAAYLNGIYYSSDNGDTWSQIFSISDIGRTSIGFGTGNFVYVSIARYSNSSMLGVYRTSNNGASWINISPANEIFGSGGSYQGWYDNIISGAPHIDGLVLLGGILLYRSTNYGITWNQVTDLNVHVDQHYIAWSTSGDSVWVGNDGGLTISSNAGVTWSSISNRFPITQYVNIGVSGNFSHPFTGEIYGGSQDNGVSGTTNFGTLWYETLDGDGGGTCIDPNNPNMVWSTIGVYSIWSFLRARSTNYGRDWIFTNNGIDPSNEWFTKIRTDQVGNVTLYINSDNWVYYSTNRGDQWLKLNTTQFPAWVSNVNVSVYSNPSAVVYACLIDTNTGSRLRVFDSTTWYERSSGFPPQTMVRGVAQHPTNNNIAYALMNGLSSAQKIFKTTNRGINWTDITGDLPNILVSDLISHPTDSAKLYLGSEMGCYKTTNGGINWIRWNNGLSASTIVTELCYADSTTINGKYYIIAGTYGRSVYVRDISGDDPIAVKKINNNVPRNYSLGQNYPNPFNPSTKIEFILPVKDFVELKVYDILGSETAIILNQELPAGSHIITFDASNLSSGVYFYRLRTPKFIDVKKMIILK